MTRQGWIMRNICPPCKTRACREGNGGALKEYGLLAAHLSKPMVEQMSGIANWTEGGAPAPAKGTEEFDAKAQENAAVLTQSLPGIIDTAGQDFRGYNQTFLQKLQTAMPDTMGKDNDTAEAFVAKSAPCAASSPSMSTAWIPRPRLWASARASAASRRSTQ